MDEDSPSLPATPSVGSSPPEGSDWLSDGTLLRRYADRQDEAAFAELVRRHVDLVYATALRKVGGDAHSARDVTQRVFTDLARKAAPLAGHPVLTGWLFTATHYAATQFVRAERRRRLHEQTAHTMNDLAQDPAAAIDGERLRPLLDDVVLELNERDREAVLLRFFEGRGFAEVGARLQLSEDGARSRVERALEKMQALFARRGVTSTSAALALALGSQAAGATAPAALAASVATSALASAAGGSAAASGWLATLTFMSTTKFTGGAIVLALALIASVAINGYLLLQHPAQTPQPASSASVVTRPTTSAVARVATPALNEEPATLRDRLLAGGMNATAARGVVEGLLRRRYREKLVGLRAEQMKHAWWQDTSWWFQMSSAPGTASFVDNPQLLREMVTDPLLQLFGPDPAQVAELDAQYEFLPAEQRAGFIALEREHEAALARLPPGDRLASQLLTADYERKQRELLQALAPAARSEHELRFGTATLGLRGRMKEIQATEGEYRAIAAIVLAPSQSPQDRPSVNLTAEDEGRLAQLVTTLGYDRALDYIWSGAREYPTIARVAAEAGLPATTAGRVMQLAAETAAKATQIHTDPARTPDTKHAAVLALQQEMRPRLDAILPPELQAKAAGEAMLWFTALGEGRYRVILTTTGRNSGGVTMMGATSVTTPPPPAAQLRKQYVVPSRAAN